MKRARKTNRRMVLTDDISNTLTSEQIYSAIQAREMTKPSFDDSLIPFCLSRLKISTADGNKMLAIKRL